MKPIKVKIMKIYRIEIKDNINQQILIALFKLK